MCSTASNRIRVLSME